MPLRGGVHWHPLGGTHTTNAQRTTRSTNMVFDGERSHTVDVQATQARVSGAGGTTPDHYDLLLLGSGSTAFAAATRARDLGKTAVMIAARTLGGTCVNRGCLPSKNLIAAAQLVYDAAHPRYPGLMPVELPADFRALIAQKDELIAEYRDLHYASILSEGPGPNAVQPIQVVAGPAVL